MTPERWLRIEELYHSARKTGPGVLSGVEPELRREVEALLAQDSLGKILDQPALDLLAQIPAAPGAPRVLPAELRREVESLDPPAVAGLAAGACPGPYRIESTLGQGGMGEVFRAVDTRLGRAVAIKTTREQFSARFEREARAIASLNHPNICTLHDIGPNYLVMELVEGETLAARLKSGPLPVKTALLYASQIVAALAEAHSKGIVHRDLKPGNIMIAKSGVKVLDFGLAKSIQDEAVTVSHLVMGTPAYMAPEQREGQPADARSDIYSFGCVLYEMLTGARVASHRSRLPSGKLERIISRCLEEDPRRRWQSAVELERALAGVTVTGSAWKRKLAAAAVILGFTAAAYFYFHRAPGLTDKDTIVLADFVNNTGDPVFDGTLRQGLAVQLEQSPFLKIMDDGQVQRALGLMSLPPGTRITNQVAHEVCVREGAAATIDGIIASLGKDYVITLEAIACQDGATLAREQIQAEDKEHVLNVVGTAATAMRGKLGESLNSIRKLNRPLEQATTPSLEALQNYTEGYDEVVQGHFLTAVPLLERAKTIDPNFAMAYHLLSIAFENAGDAASSRECARQAYGLVDRVSEFERDYIAPRYYWAAGEVDKAIDAYQLGIRNYPRFWGFHNYLGLMYNDLGRFEEGLKEGQEAARLQPNIEHPYRRQLDAYICLDRLAEAERLAQRLRTQGFDGSRIHQRFLQMAYVEGDQAAIGREIQWFAGKPEEYISFALQAADRNVHGRRRESHKLYQRAEETALRLGLQDLAADSQIADLRADALVGNCQTVRRLGRPALAVALCGDAPQAEKLAAETSRLFPNGTIWNSVHLPEIQAAIAINRDQPARSVDLLASASPYERSYLGAVYLRGLAYLRLHQGAEAAAEFRKVVDHKGPNWTERERYPGEFYSLSYLGMARGLALAGDKAKAQKSFQDFFELWKDADPDLPILQQAKADYARLL